MGNKSLNSKLYTAHKRLEYCKSAKATADIELAYAQGVMDDILTEAKASMTPVEIEQAINKN